MSESPIIAFVRGFTLLAILLVLPGIAIFWNHLPKNLGSGSEPRSAARERETFSRNLPRPPARSDSVLSPEAALPVLLPPAIQTATVSHAMVAVPQPQIAPAQAMMAQQVSWEQPLTESLPMALPIPAPPLTAQPSTAPPRDFESLKLHLHALGATSYSLVRWGNRGELFRFSCLVASPGPHAYEKHFQAIGADEMTVLQTVIAEIERWKNAR